MTRLGMWGCWIDTKSKCCQADEEIGLLTVVPRSMPVLSLWATREIKPQAGPSDCTHSPVQPLLSVTLLV